LSKKRGSITVFLALLLTCVFSSIFALLEAARVSCLKTNAGICTAQAQDGLLASYNRALWEDYHLMFWEGTQGDFPELTSACNLQQEIVEGNWENANAFGNNFYLFPVHLTSVSVQSYQLATDDDGAAFRREASEMMKQTLAEDAIESLASWITGTDETKNEEKAKQQEESAMDVLQDLQQGAMTGDNDTTGNSQSDVSLPEDSQSNVSLSVDSQSNVSLTDNSQSDRSLLDNSQPDALSVDNANSGVTLSNNPIQWMKEVKEKGIFAILMPETELSQKHIDSSDSVARRTLQTGTMRQEYSANASEKLLFRLYLCNYFSDATKSSKDKALDYELEYFIAGKDSDQANLKSVVNRLLLLREAANMTYLETNSQKKQEALVIALALTSVVGHPELAEPVKHGVLAAWAFAESLSDVRILLDGGKVSMVKTDAQWHTELNNLSSTIRATEGSSQQNGLSYQGYLQILLWTTSDKKLAQRAMTLIEKDTGVQMDQMVYQMNCTYQYESQPLFWSFVRLGNTSVSGYQFSESGVFGYE
jgi:hypothetical protein